MLLLLLLLQLGAVQLQPPLGAQRGGSRRLLRAAEARTPARPPSEPAYGQCARLRGSKRSEVQRTVTELSNVAHFAPVLAQADLEKRALEVLVQTDPVFANVSASLAAARLSTPGHADPRAQRRAARERDQALRRLLRCSGDTGTVDLGALAANSNHSFALVLASEGRPPELYGHVWGAINAFFCTFVARRAETAMSAAGARAPPPATLTIYVGVGSSPRSAAHAELAALFSDADAPDPRRRLVHLRVVRAPWVPTNLGDCYATHAPVPPWAVGRLPLVHGHHALHRLYQVLPALRPVAHRLLGAPADLHDTILYCAAARGSNGRRIVDEAAVVAALRAWAARAHPQLRFVVQDPQGLDYLDELRLFARARVVVALFGSTLHNCRFMRPGSILVEIKGALRNLVYGSWFYYEICARQEAVRYAAFPADNAAPFASQADAEAGRDFVDHAELEARVDAAELVRFMERVAPAQPPRARVDWVRALSVWEKYTLSKPDWNSWRRKLPPEQRLSSWGAHSSSVRPRSLVWVRNRTDAGGNELPEFVEQLPSQYTEYVGV